MVLRTTSSHKEGADRRWSILTRRFEGEGDSVRALQTVELEWKDRAFSEVEGSLRVWPADLVVLAIGYTGPEKNGLLDQLSIDMDDRGNVKTDTYQTSLAGVFSAGDMRRGQSLIVWAISEGREAARAVDRFLQDSTSLPTRGPGSLPHRR
jgi:glutamate synthase (NADPH/NADH) small chain